MADVKKASPERIKAQVLGLRPNAKAVIGGIGHIIMDGEDALSAAGGGYVATEAEAWNHAFEYLMWQRKEHHDG